MNTDRFKFRIFCEDLDGEKEYLYFDLWDIQDVVNQEELRPDEIEQCTGLGDKNGKLIFEGDIVSGFCNKCRVCFGNGSFRWSSETGVPLTQTECDFTEVIGNIHQNPEMVK